MNLGTFVVGLLLILLVAWVVYGMIRDKKAGKGCGCGCSGCSGGCSGCGMAQSNKKEK